MGPKSEEILPSLRFEVFDIVSLVKDHVYPRHTAENVLVGKDELVRSDANMKRVPRFPAMPSFFSLPDVTIICHNFEARKEFLQLHLPIFQDAGWDDNKVRAPDLTRLTMNICRG